MEHMGTHLTEEMRKFYEADLEDAMSSTSSKCKDRFYTSVDLCIVPDPRQPNRKPWVSDMQYNGDYGSFG